MPYEGRWVCVDCGYVMFGDEPTVCESCGCPELDEDTEGYDDEDEEPPVPWLTKGELWALEQRDKNNGSKA